jgi:putative ABC transport system permease protein
MLSSLLKTALRNIFRHPSFSLINIIGLSVSMSLGLLIITVVKDQYSFDNFHSDAERIYRVNTRAIRTSGDTEDYASVPLPIADVLRNYQFAEEVVSLCRAFSGDATYQDTNVPVRGLLADPMFLNVFTFPLQRGNPATALSEPNGIVLTAETAERIFGQEEPLGRSLTVGRYGDFKVTGVLEKFPSQTHFEFQVLVPMDRLRQFERDGLSSSTTDNWKNYYSSYIYFKLKPGTPIAEVEDALGSMAEEKYRNLKLETRDKGYSFFLLPLTKLTPGPVLSNQMGNGMPRLLLIMLGSLAAIVMLMACFNYTNLMIAKSLTRAREIGVRKAIGARRWQIFVQFVGEGVVFSFFSLAISYLMLQLLKPAFMQLHITQEFAVSLNEDFSLLLYFIVFATLFGVFAGLLPAGYLSAFNVVKVLKGGGNQKVYSRVTLRRGLMVMQFTLSLTFFIVVSIIYRQVDFMFSKDYGIREDGIVNVRLQGVPFEDLRREVVQLPGVVRVGAVSHALGTWADRSSSYKRLASEEPFVMRDFLVDNNYLDNIEVQFVAGKNFDETDEVAAEKFVIINETALQRFDLEDAIAAVGQTIVVDDSVLLTVIGVVKDFHFRPLNYEIGPVAFRNRTDEAAFLSIAVSTDQQAAVVAALSPIWKKLDPIHALEWQTMADQIDQAYVEAGFTDVVTIVGYIAFLAITLACLGILGMAMYATQTRTKEIGIRKVMGADVTSLTVLLSRSFLYLLVLATLFAVPLSIYFGDAFLNTYAYKAPITPLVVLTGVVVVTLIGLVTICSQTLRAAMANPVGALRYE